MPKKTSFNGYNVTLQFLRMDKSVRVTIDTSLDQWVNIKDIPLLAEGVYKITIEPEVEEITKKN